MLSPADINLGLTAFSAPPCQHLVTFCLGEEDGVHTVEDASRKLAVMDNQGRVWAQEMLLRVSPDHVTLLDPISKVPGDTWVESASGLSERGHGELDPRDV